MILLILILILLIFGGIELVSFAPLTPQVSHILKDLTVILTVLLAIFIILYGVKL